MPFIKIIEGNCLEVLPTLQTRSVNLVVTDPPYGMRYHSGYYKNGNPHPKIVGDEKVDARFIRLCNLLLKKNSAMFVFCDLGHSWSEIKEAMGDTYQNTIVWVKNNWTAGDLNCDFGNQYELIAYGIKGRPKIRDRRFSNVWNFDRVNSTELLHPTQKPLPLVKRLIESLSDDGDVVLDPFLGSGTTAVACKELGRSCIGIEINSDYVEIAKKRVANTHQTRNMEEIF